ncbi:group III truncated hemoglobin [Pacificibacter marinus]|jgi:hemoglobin|uniref:Group 3 truncated hemoglobin ctb n=1 Tax=Pacificibacter marinus TaxID=658057 RepID=A0A1Y5RGF7_9RHOB|nr:group III truncated hemoglobin [Pacificibacter marinus]SEK20154.1 hemoglobin [Pacificibacter marinus]SLN16874.1 Group 3 truncated hemoglobin ctb [Pacificibacter marinus]
MSVMLPKFPISPEHIELVVTRFYAKVRNHSELGPIFANHVHDWPPHEAKITRFWRNAIGIERNYDGNPQRAHMAAPDIQGHHFALWLGLFDETLQDSLAPETAAAWSALAHRIGRALKMSIDQRDAPKDAPPRLF